MLVNKYNDQFIADKTSSRAGVTCSKSSLMSGGGPYGVTSESVNADVAAGLGKARPSAIGHYSHCNSQKGGSAGHDYDADSVGQTYGYTKAGAAYAGEVRGGYAPITRQPKTNMCGGKRRRKNKSRKSRRKSRRKSKKSRRRKTKRRKRKTKRRRGGKTNAEMMACMEENAGLGPVKANLKCRQPTMAKPVSGCVDDMTATYGSEGRGSCANLQRRIAYSKSNPKPGQREALEKFCAGDAGKHCKKSCSEYGQPCPAPVIAPKQLPVVEAPKPTPMPVVKAAPVTPMGPQRGTGECDQHNFYDGVVFKKSEGKLCRSKKSSCKLAKGKKKSSPMNTRKCISRKGGRRKSRKKSRKKRKRMKGGRYQQYGSNIPNTPGYSGPYTAGPMPWATGPVGINRQMNC